MLIIQRRRLPYQVIESVKRKTDYGAFTRKHEPIGCIHCGRAATKEAYFKLVHGTAKILKTAIVLHQLVVQLKIQSHTRLANAAALIITINIRIFVHSLESSYRISHFHHSFPPPLTGSSSCLSSSFSGL